MNRIARFAIILFAFAVAVAGLPSCAQATTGGVNDYIEMSSTDTLIKVYYMNSINEQLYAATGSLPWNIVDGAIGQTDDPTMITISTNEMNGLRTHSQLAPLAAMASQVVKYLGSPAYDGKPVASTMDQSVCAVGAIVKGFLYEFRSTATASDIAMMHEVVIDGFSPAVAVDSTVAESFDLGLSKGFNACGIHF